MMYIGSEGKVIRKATSLDPKQRYMSVQGLLNDLRIKKELTPAEITYNLPGFGSESKVKKVFSLIGYLAVLLFCFSAPVTSNGALATGLAAFFYRTGMYVMIMTTILIIGNYCNSRNYCFFSKSNYFLARVFGIVLYLLMLLFFELMFISIIIIFFKID